MKSDCQSPRARHAIRAVLGSILLALLAVSAGPVAHAQEAAADAVAPAATPTPVPTTTTTAAETAITPSSATETPTAVPGAGVNPTAAPPYNQGARPLPPRIRPGMNPAALRPGAAAAAAAVPGRVGVGPGGVPVAGAPIPGVPGVPGAAGTGGEAGASTTEELGALADQASQLGEEDTIPMVFENAPIESVLNIYSKLVQRVLLRPPQLAGGPFSLDADGLTRDESIEAFNALFALNGISVIPVGEKFLKVVPSQQVVQEGAQSSDLPVEELSELGQYVVKLVKVTKIKPGDIAQAVQQFASSKVQNPVLVFDDQNFFILRDMAANVKRMTELIKELDVTPELDYKLEVIPIRYGKVEEIYDTLNSVVTGQSSGMGSRTSNRASGFRSGTTGTGVGGVGGTTGGFSPQQAGSTLGSRTGTSTGMTSPGAARSSFADRLRSVSSAAAGGGAQYNLLADARIIPDMRSNSLLVYANKEDFKMLTNIVAKIDTLLAQVLIESIILEVGLEKGQDIGVSMVQNPQQFGNWTGAGGSINDANIATNLLTSLFPSGFSYFAQYKDDFAVAVRAIANDSNAKVLARPRIQTTHAQSAQFEIGDTVPYPRSSSPFYGGGGIGGGFTPFTTYDEKRVTTRLTVTPYITPDGLVTLEVEQVIDQLGPTTKVGTDEIPTIRTRNASAVLSVRDREPVILGGFITDRKTESVSGVPWLKDIPLLGWAFRSKNDFKQRSELIVLIRPTVLNTPQEASKLAELERRSLPNAAATAREFQRDEAEMAERLGVLPGSTNSVFEDGGTKPKSSRRSRRNRD